MASISVRGAEDLTKVAAVLSKHAEGKSITRLLRRDIRDQSDHITREQRANLAARMPHRGGLAAALSTQGKFSVSTRLAGRSVGVTIVDSWKGHDMRAVEAGLIRHPYWGRWVRGNRPQTVPRGTLSEPVDRSKVPLQFAIVRSLNVLAEEIARET